MLAENLGEILPNRYEGSLRNLPSGDLATHFLPRAIDIFLQVSYTIAFGFLVYAGVLYIIDDTGGQDVEKAKDIFIYTIVAAIVVTVAYAVVQGIMRINFF